MAIELHHLHPGHDDDLSRLKARIAELEKENAELKEQYRNMDVTHTVHIAKMNALIEELEESQRWRKFPEEKPEKDGLYDVVAIYPGDSEYDRELCDYSTEEEAFGELEEMYADGEKEGECFIESDVKWWKPLPIAPKEEK